ncbi:protein of unknown function [Methylorubrum extorquens]|uniref:Uncharacterized protein n=1 Tax=Methylorubrum extorquens TaxID=408 RepID=A0A2N9ANE5_METEX|nr:hypothetical protein ASF36_19050 [Methylobacterium sp. Leaf90]SOR28813.1 protein of unknown function [Methylorubrum extorquens]
MARVPEFVVTGVHIPRVHFWARVLVEPERLQQVKDLALRQGQIFLNPGEVLQVDTSGTRERERALTVSGFETDTPRLTCLVAWNEIAGDITIYGDDTDDLPVIARSVEIALTGMAAAQGGVALRFEGLTSIQVGDVQVFFPRKEVEELSPESVLNQIEEERSYFRSRGHAYPPDAADEPAAQDPDRYPSSVLKAGEKLRAPRGTAIRSGRSA